MLPEPVKNFIVVFSSLPSIGPRQAIRLAFKLISGGKNKIESVAKAVADLRLLKICQNCFFVHSNRDNFCNICSDKNRQKNVIMIVEKETDLISLEKPGVYKGRYLIVGELSKSSLLDSFQKLRLNNLKNFIKKELAGQAEEIIIALNPTTYGDLETAIIAKELEGCAKKISRLGRGIPTGGEIEFADEETLAQALKRRS